MPLGHTTVPTTFQRILNAVLPGHKRDKMFPFPSRHCGWCNSSSRTSKESSELCLEDSGDI